MSEKNWTPDQIHKLTVSDIMILCSETTTDKKGNVKLKRNQFNSLGGGTGSIESVDEAMALQARLVAERAAEAEAWKGNGNA
jgi:hypothetical protein